MEARLLTEKPRKPAPRVSLGHAYSPAPGGVESNLLVLLHGLGDTHVPFLTLGRTLQAQLPQCAVLSLDAPSQVPMLGGGMWWEHWDELGEVLVPDAQNPSKAINALSALLTSLVDSTGWPAKAIHLLGFGQGASAAAEAALSWTRSRKGKDGEQGLGSVVAICGACISFPTPPATSTPLLYMHRSPATAAAALSSLRRGFAPVVEQALAPGPDAMPRGAEWGAMLKFWSAGRWRNRSKWERDGEVYAVEPSAAPPK